MTLSKSARFEIFKRDGFTCQYCGTRPPDVVLEVDHIHPVSLGGTDDALNLVTSCYACNRGKAAKTLGSVSPKPDADLEFLGIQQEVAELRRYLAAKEQRDEVTSLVIAALQQTWAAEVSEWTVPPDSQFKGWLVRYPPEDIEKALCIAGPKAKGGHISRQWYDVSRYVTGILKNMEADRVG